MGMMREYYKLIRLRLILLLILMQIAIPAHAVILFEDDPVTVTPIPGEQIPNGDPVAPLPPGMPLIIMPPGPPAFAGQDILDIQQAHLAPEQLGQNHAQMQPFKLSAIHYDGNRFTRNSVIEKAIQSLRRYQETGITLAQLHRELALINAHHLFQIKASLLGGNQENMKQLNIQVYEAQPIQFAATADNQGRQRSGLYRVGMDVSDDNVLGLEDRLRFQAFRTVDQTGFVAFRGAYQLPVNRWGGNINLFSEWQRTEITDTAFRDFPLLPPGIPRPPFHSAENVMAGTDFIQPLNASRTLSADAGFIIRQLRLNGIYPAGRVFYGGFHYVRPDRSGLTQLHLLSFLDTKILGGKTSLWMTMLDASREIRLPKDQSLLLRTHLQYMPGGLGTGELIYPLTGEYAVRGYPEDMIFLQSGTVSNLEYYFPIPFSNRIHPGLSKRVKGVLFYDAGLGSYRAVNQRYFHSTMMNGMGVGVRVRLTQALQGFLDLGWGVGSASNFPDGRQNEFGSHIPPSFKLYWGIRSDLLPRPYTTSSHSSPKTASIN